MGDNNSVDSKTDSKARISLLKRILQIISGGGFDNTESSEPLKNDNGLSRPSYFSSEDRGTYNYGYTEMKEYDY
jgi:hypothetical protein